VAIGPGADSVIQLAPLIDKASRDQVLGTVEEAGRHSEILLKGGVVDAGIPGRGRIVAQASLQPSLPVYRLFRRKCLGQ
jgi:acyl-CoA reductase-like NAD-dependent aldehyde dehydrogenase